MQIFIWMNETYAFLCDHIFAYQVLGSFILFHFLKGIRVVPLHILKNGRVRLLASKPKASRYQPGSNFIQVQQRNTSGDQDLRQEVSHYNKFRQRSVRSSVLVSVGLGRPDKVQNRMRRRHASEKPCTWPHLSPRYDRLRDASTMLLAETILPEEARLFNKTADIVVEVEDFGPRNVKSIRL